MSARIFPVVNARLAVVAAIVAFVAVNIMFLGARPVLSADETRYGSIAAQMVQSGDWLQLQMSGFLFYEKPPLVYWMTAASIEAFGRNAFAIRLPAALCGGLAALAVGVAARRGARLAGADADAATVIGALVSLASVTMALQAVGSSVAILDAPIAGMVLAASACFFCGATEVPGRRRLMWLVAAGVFTGLAFMTKGLLAVVFPAVTVGPWLAWERRWRDLVVLPWIPLAVGAAVIAPWAWAVTEHAPGFWTRFIVHEHFQRFAGSGSNQPTEPWAFYLLIVPLGAIPWIVTAPIAAPRWRALCRTRTGCRFAACAVLGPLVFLSASRGKLPTYALPVLPPLAWLLVEGLLAAFGAMQDAWRVRWIALVPGAILVSAGVAALGLALAGDASAALLGRAWSGAVHGHAAVLGAALVLWGAGDWVAQRTRPGPSRVLWMGLSPVAALASFGLLFPDAAVDEALATGPSIRSDAGAITAADTLICDQKLAHASAWFLDRTDFLVVGAPREFLNGLDRPEDSDRLVTEGAFADRLRLAQRDGSVLLAAVTPAVDRLSAMPGVPVPQERVDHRGWSWVRWPAAPVP